MSALLATSGLHCGYGADEIIHAVNVEVAAGEIVTHDEFADPLRQQAAARLGGFVAEVLRERRLRHQPALLGRKRRCHAWARLMEEQKRLRLAASAGAKGWMRQDMVGIHRHGPIVSLPGSRSRCRDGPADPPPISRRWIWTS